MSVCISPSLLSASRSRTRRGRWMAKTKLAKNEWKWHVYTHNVITFILVWQVAMTLLKTIDKEILKCLPIHYQCSRKILRETKHVLPTYSDIGKPVPVNASIIFIRLI